MILNCSVSVFGYFNILSFCHFGHCNTLMGKRRYVRPRLLSAQCSMIKHRYVRQTPSSMVKRRYVHQKLYQLKAQWSNVAVPARTYVTLKFHGQTSLCPPESIAVQSSMLKRRYVRQKLYRLKASNQKTSYSQDQPALPCKPSVPG